MYSTPVTWWLFLCGVSILNVLVWSTSASFLHSRHLVKSPVKFHPLKPGDWSVMHWQIILSCGYVLGCAYRSAFPVYDVQRVVMVDSWLSSVIVGRSVATIAELCFAAQWALLLRCVALSCNHGAAFNVSRLIVPLILIAEVCSWYAVLTTANIGHVMEESIWGLSAALMVASFASLVPRSDRRLRPLLGLACLAGFAYVVYMFTVDVPMYWDRWVTDEGRGHIYLSIAQGLADTSGRWVVSHNWKDWESEVVWMSLYFSVAVWLSIGLMHVAGILKTAHAPVWLKAAKQ
jgi:hypothetical protein